MVTTALKMALWRRDHEGRRIGDGLIHHSDAGSQYTSIAFSETLGIEGIAASIVARFGRRDGARPVAAIAKPAA